MNRKTKIIYLFLAITTWVVSGVYGTYSAQRPSLVEKSSTSSTNRGRLTGIANESNFTTPDEYRAHLAKEFKRALGSEKLFAELLAAAPDDKTRMEAVYVIALGNAMDHPQLAIKFLEEEGQDFFTDTRMLAQLFSSDHLSWEERIRLLDRVPVGAPRLDSCGFYGQLLAKADAATRMTALAKLRESSILSEYEYAFVTRITGQHLAEVNPQAAIEFHNATGYGKADEDMASYQNIGALLARTRAAEGLATVREVNESSAKKVAFTGYIDELAVKQPQIAFATALETYSVDKHVHTAMVRALNHWVNRDPQQAYAALRESGLSERDMNAMLLETYSTMLQSDPAFAKEIAEKSVTSPATRDALLSVAAQYYGSDANVTAGISAAAMIMDTSIRNRALQNVGTYAAQQSKADFISRWSGGTAPPNDNFILGGLSHLLQDPVNFPYIPQIAEQISDQNLRIGVLAEWYNANSNDPTIADAMLQTQLDWEQNNPELVEQIKQR